MTWSVVVDELEDDWHHILLNIDTDELELFVDGASQGAR